MNKFIKSAVAVAVTSLFAGGAFAAVDIDANTGQKVYAKELVAASQDFANVANALDVNAKLGFGVSSGQSRFIRIQLDGATFNAGAPVLTLPDTDGNSGVTTGTVVASGANYFIFEITASQNYTQDTVVTFAPHAAGVKATGSASPTVTYKLYDGASNADQNGTTGQLGATKTANLYTTQNALVYTVVSGDATASVAKSYEEFLVASGDQAFTAALGTIKFGVDGTSLKPAGGVAALADLVTTADVVVTGDFGAVAPGAPAAATGVFLDNTNFDCSVTNGFVATIAGQTATFTVDTTALDDARLCYTVTGATAVVKQTIANGNPITAALDVKTAPASSSANDQSAANVGEIKHDGITLTAPFLNSKTGQKSYVQLINKSATQDAPYSVKCITYSGPVAGTINNLVLPKGTKSRALSAVGLGCPSNTTGAEMTFAISAGNVIGTLVRENAATGDAAIGALLD